MKRKVHALHFKTIKFLAQRSKMDKMQLSRFETSHIYIYLPAHLNICHYYFTPPPPLPPLVPRSPRETSFFDGKRDRRPAKNPLPRHDGTMRKNVFNSSRSLRRIPTLARYIFHRRYRLENPARPIVDASWPPLRRKNAPREKFNRCATGSPSSHLHRRP